MIKILAPLTDNFNVPISTSIWDNNNWWTPINWTAKNGHTKFVEILASLTDNPNAASNAGDTPIHLAAKFGQTEIVKILSLITDNPNAPDKDGETPIYLAAVMGRSEIILLAPLTENPNLPDKNGYTPIYMAVRYGAIWAHRNCQNIGAFVQQP